MALYRDRQTSGELCYNGSCDGRLGCLRKTTCSSTACSAQTDCEACTSVVGQQCSWLSPRSVCVPRDESGLSVCGSDQTIGQCVRSARYTCAPRTGCGTHTDCNSCIQSTNSCGWCTSSNTCMEANDNGQTCSNGTCNGCLFRKSTDYCPTNFAPTCDGQDCSTCLKSKGCGWCSTTGQCFAASYNADQGRTYICDASVNSCPGCVYSWMQADSFCPKASGALCSDYHNCQACTDAAPRGCAWCTKSSTCVSVYTSPTTGDMTTCGNQTCNGCMRDWLTASTYCAPNHGSCSDYTTCLSCTGTATQRGCGWCTSTNKCIDVRRGDYGACDATSCYGCVRSFVSAPSYCPATAGTCR
jgi:hypothetical protein